MADPSQVWSRTGTGADLPGQEAFAADVIGDVRSESTIMRLGNVIQTSSLDSRIPILSQDVDAYFLGSDADWKRVSIPTWDSGSLYSVEIAVIVPIPDSAIADSGIPLWSMIRGLVARAFARRIDAAALFGVGRPTSWGPSLVELAETNSATVESTADPVADVLNAAEIVSGQQRNPNAVAVRNGWQFAAGARRTSDFHSSPVEKNARAPFPLTVAGMSVETDPTYWDPTAAEAVIADWRNVVVGLRQDLTITMHTDGTIVDPATGQIVMSLMQNDATAMRAVLRMGFRVTTPVNGNSGPACPVAIVKPATP